MESFRYNYEATDENLLVCYNNHPKESPCEFVKLCPHDSLKHINEMRSAALESVALLARHNALREAVAWERECSSDDMCGVLANYANHLLVRHGEDYLDEIQEDFDNIIDAARAEVDRLLGEGEG